MKISIFTKLFIAVSAFNFVYLPLHAGPCAYLKCPSGQEPRPLDEKYPDRGCQCVTIGS